MFRQYEYYKHVEGRDAVIMVRNVRKLDQGYELEITWHILSYHGSINAPVTKPSYIFVSNEDAEFWNLYQGESL